MPKMMMVVVVGALLSMNFLPDFCHCCGVIGHTDRRCATPIPEKDRQYGRWLRVLPPKRQFSEDVGRGYQEGRGQPVVQQSHSIGDWRREKERDKAAAATKGAWQENSHTQPLVKERKEEWVVRRRT